MTVEENKGPVLGMRHVQTFLIFLNITVVYISRLNIGVAVVAMTNPDTTNPDFPDFDWNEKQISYILSSFYWGYVVTQFPGGALCRRFGVKLTMGISTFGSTILSALTPSFVNWGGWQALCVIRIVQGLFQGMLFPCIHQHLAKWSPLQERNRLGALSHTGIEFGTVLAMGITGLIAEGPMGWPGISYVSAGLCLFWCVLWVAFGANNATVSRFITEDEKHYIESSMDHKDDFHHKKIPVPWKAILISIPFNALLVTRCAGAWGLTTLQAQIPSYLNGVLNMDIKSNALYSALPFLAMWAMSYVYVIIADILQSKNVLTLTTIRKSINSTAFWIPAVGLIAIGFLDEDNKKLAITLMTLNVGVHSGATLGSSLNTIDLSPNHAGIQMGIVNTIANFMPLISPLVVGVIVTDNSNRSQWQIVFAISAVVLFVGNVIYLIFGTSVVQPWDAENFLLPKDVESSSNHADCDKCDAGAIAKAAEAKKSQIHSDNNRVTHIK